MMRTGPGVIIARATASRERHDLKKNNRRSRRRPWGASGKAAYTPLLSQDFIGLLRTPPFSNPR